MPRPQTKSGAALRYERQRREATAALAAQAAQVRALREVSPPPGGEGVADDPPPSAGEGVSAEADMGNPITETDQRVTVGEHPPVVEGGEGHGGAEPVIGIPITEQDQQVTAGPKVRAEQLAEPVMSVFSPSQEVPKTDMRPEPGRWPITALREGQCRFACTPDSAERHQHLFCGEPVVWVKGKPESYCRQHLPVVHAAPGRAAGGASVADLQEAK